jgi:hypothetical protein
MKMKEFDLKKFLLQKGERVGLWVAVGITGAILAFWLFWPGKGLFSGSAAANAEALKKKSNDLRQRVGAARSHVDGEVQRLAGQLTDQEREELKKTLDPTLTAKADFQPEDFLKFYIAGEYFAGRAVDDQKRRAPKLLAPDEFRAVVELAQVRSHILNDAHTKIMVIKGVEGAGSGVKDLAKLMKGMSGSAGMRPPPGGAPGAAPPGGAHPGPGRPGGFMGMMGGMMGGPGGRSPFGGPGGMMMGRGTPPPSDSEKEKINYGFVELDKLEDQKDVKLADDILPVRMAIVVAALPYKKQLEEFQKALRYPTLEALYADKESVPQFEELLVERQEISADGKGKGWAKLDLDRSLRPLFFLTRARYAPDDPELADLIFDGLVIPRPLQFRTDAYSQKAETQLKHIQDTLAELKKAAQGERTVVRPAQLTEEGINPFKPRSTEGGDNAQMGPNGPMGPAGGPKPMGSGAVKPPMGTMPPGMNSGNPFGQGSGPVVIPEYCLVRFLDVTIEPGKTYEYRFKIKMHNPNYKRTDVAYPEIAEKEDIVSPDWIPVPERVRVAPELRYYAVDQKDVDQKTMPKKDFLKAWGTARAPQAGQVMLQAHRWVDLVYPDLTNRRTSYAVGDWIVADRYPVSRGEYTGQPAKTEVPIWNFPEEKFVLATVGKGKERTVPVVFGDDTPENNPLLVDFQGGDLTYYRVVPGADEDKKASTTKVQDKAPVEVLLLTPDGRLLVRDSETDAQDEERSKRQEAWKSKVANLKPKKEDKSTDRPNPFGEKPDEKP